jgi:hypothetical protein
MTPTDEQRAKVEALIGAKVMGLDVRGMHQCYQCEGCWDVDDDLAWTGSGHERVRPVYRVGEGWTPEPDERIIFGCPAHSLGVLPEYTTSGDAMLEVIEKMRANDWDFRHEACAGRVELAEFAKWDEVYKDEYMKFCADAPTMPLAVCLASLSAVGVDWRAELGVKEEAE